MPEREPVAPVQLTVQSIQTLLFDGHGGRAARLIEHHIALA
jgi:hypothetical protein